MQTLGAHSEPMVYPPSPIESISTVHEPKAKSELAHAVGCEGLL